MATIDLDDAMIDQNADQVRRKLRRITDNKEMTVKALCETLQVSSTSYSNFMRQSGSTKGTQSDVFMNAWECLTKRATVGVKLPVAKKAKNAESDSRTAKGKANTSISEVHLDGEERDAVPVYMTCDAVRRQITVHLQKTGTSQAQFCRDLSAQLHAESVAAIKPNALTTFRGKKGANGGATSKVFYAAYVLFEKQRMAEGKAKSKMRQELKEVWGAKGMDRDHDASTGYWMHTSERMDIDKYGRIYETDCGGGIFVTCPESGQPVIDKYGRVEILQEGTYITPAIRRKIWNYIPEDAEAFCKKWAP
ncbi:hypothetical protein B0A48_17965 [Cryoendolithus antarcticus]|uniref:DUF7726 domain-containing protein n=1 Tax=Cryoendolithus antarcticus TaxID=1507870 RepID=A0A1V8S9C6_9PEZI|nr:hypothetical protein B0A48_17965 [Cryoendolithus antarcticus]